MAPIVEQDPLSGYNRAIQVWLPAFSGRYDEGIAEALAAVELDPHRSSRTGSYRAPTPSPVGTRKRSLRGTGRWPSRGDIRLR